MGTSGGPATSLHMRIPFPLLALENQSLVDQEKKCNFLLQSFGGPLKPLYPITFSQIGRRQECPADGCWDADERDSPWKGRERQ